MDFETAHALGNVGERRVADLLALEAPALGLRVVNDVLLLDDQTSAQIDHLVVDRFGVLVVETKNYHALIRGKSNDKRWTACYPGRGKKRESFLNPLRQNDRHREMIHRVLGAHGLALPPEYVQSLVVFAGGNLKALQVDDVDSMRVVPDSEVVDYLRARCGDFPPNHGALDPEQVGNVASLLHAMNQADNPDAVAAHADNVQRASARWGYPRLAQRSAARTARASSPYAPRQVFYSNDRYPDGSQLGRRRTLRMPTSFRRLLAVALVLAFGWWFMTSGTMEWALRAMQPAVSVWVTASLPKTAVAPAASVAPDMDAQTVSYSVPLALQRLQEASPDIYQHLSSPRRPELSTIDGLPTYTWSYLAKQRNDAVSVRTISITLGPNGQIVGATGTK